MELNFKDEIEIILAVITALATVVIAYSTRRTEKSQDKFQEQLSDLYQGIIIATLLSSNSSPQVLDDFIARFKQKYTGKTKIF